MTIRNFEALFRPRSIAIVGASRKPGSLGDVLARNMFESGFEGPIMPVHPKEAYIHSVTAYPDIKSLPTVPDLAVIATPPRTVPGIVEAIRKHGRDRTPFAMLSRGEAGVRRECVIINLPGSSKGALESLQALFPGLLHIFPMMRGKGHGKNKQ